MPSLTNTMTDYDEIIKLKSYSMGKPEKEKMLSSRLLALTETHYQNCGKYARILDALGVRLGDVKSYYDLPFLPVRVFKEMDLLSISDTEVFRTMTSSGTTGQAVSRIYLDKSTAINQQKTLVKIMSDFTGATRMPMLIIDTASVLKNRSMFSARGAGILGFSLFGQDRTYALSDDMDVDVEAVTNFLERHAGKQVLLFGFTYMVWQYFYKYLLKTGQKLDLSNAMLIHGGGWKKLSEEAVSALEFSERLHSVCGLTRVHDYYGMVEQTGCIYMQCEHGNLHASIFSDVIIRGHLDFSVMPMGSQGIVQVVSAIPESYPGHSLLTEDEGVLLGEDDCPCGRLGKYFRITGRIKSAEIRGCSDTFTAGSR